MNLDEYIKTHVKPTKNRTAREVFAQKIKRKTSYLHNICQDPTKAGKNTILEIEKASNGMVTFNDMCK
jgi:hypothetical protein